ADSGDWPIWSGPNHDLTSLGNGAFDDPTFGLEVLWSKPLGSGYSGISAVGNQLVTAFSDGTSDVMVALDAGSGEELWRYRMDETYRGHDASDDGPVATPTLHDGLVYGLSPRGRLFALRLADGEQVWSRRLVAELGAVEPFWGFNSTPTVIGGVLIMETGGPDGEAISGLDPATGELLWSVEDDPVGYESPTVLRIAGEEQVVALTNHLILGLVPKTGEVLWKKELKIEGGYGYAHPLPLGDGRVLVVAYPQTLLFRIGKADGGYRVEELWRTRALALRPGMALPVFYQGYLYGFTGAFLTCVDAATGETTWKSRPPGAGNLVVVDGHLVILAATGELVVAAATPAGYREQTRVQAIETGSVARPTFAAGRIYVRDLSEIAGLGVTAEAPRAKAAAEAPQVELLGEFGEFVRRLETAANKAQRIDEFLAAHQEFPILEGDDLVHFVFRGEVEDLMLVGSMLALDEELPMHRVEGTDFYFRSLRLKPGAYFPYAFAVFDEQRLDPLNPRRPDIPGQKRSVFTTRGWQEPRHLREPEGERGRFETLPWKSEILDNEREVRVYLPPGYDDGEERYPLLVVHNGGRYLEHGKFDHTLDNLVGKSVAPLVVAFLSRGGYAEFGSQAAEYSQAVAEELVPLLDDRYRTVARPEARAMMGTFNAAAISIFAALKRPDLFGRVAVQSLLLGELEDEIVALIEEGEKRDLRVYVEWSLYDLKAQEEPIFDARGDSRRLVSLLEKRGYQPTAREIVQGIGWSETAPNIFWTGWRQSTGPILETLFPVEQAGADHRFPGAL
ncbi:MAG: PQQ-binding-like beta-propeller repeat protein, partial [bacterium]|nr:PQQ-binding-like beta-propeller repeat protein [bacterium]